MRELYFVSPYRRSLRTIHFQYGSSGKKDVAGKKFILKITSGEINGRGTSEGNTEEVARNIHYSHAQSFCYQMKDAN